MPPILQQTDPVIAAIVQQMLAAGAGGVGASAVPPGRGLPPIRPNSVIPTMQDSAGAIDPRLLPQPQRPLQLQPEAGLPAQSPGAAVQQRMQQLMPSQQLSAMRTREAQRMASAPADPAAALRAQAMGVESTGYDLTTPVGPDPRSNTAAQMRQTIQDPRTMPADQRRAVLRDPRPTGSWTPDQEATGGRHPMAVPIPGGAATQGGPAGPTQEGAAAGPPELRPNRLRTGRRVQIGPQAAGAPMPPPPRPGDPSQQPGDPIKLTPSNPPDSPPSRNDGTEGSGAMKWLKSEKGQDVADWLLNFGLGTMAAAGQPGATALGAMGQGGLNAQQALTQRVDRRENRELRRETAKLNAELRRETIQANRQTAQDRIDAIRQNAQQSNDTRLMIAQIAAEGRRTAAAIAASARQSGNGAAIREAELQLRHDKAASDYVDKAMKPPSNAPLDWKPPSEETIRREVERRYPQSSIARSFRVESLDAELDAALGQLRGSGLPADEIARRETEARRRHAEKRKSILGD